MDFVIYKENNMELPQLNIESLCFSTELFSMYATCVIRIKDVSKKMFNEIKIGAPYYICFIDDNYNLIRNPMRVLSFKKIPGNNDTLVDIIELILISDWYFNSTIESKAHFGTISSIMTELFANKFPDAVCDFVATEDDSVIRYQLEENTSDFLRRILRYGIRGNLPVYLYTDHKGTINLKGVSDFLSEPPRYVALPDLATNLNVKPALGNSMGLLRLIGYKIASNNETSNSVTTTVFTTPHFASPKTKMKSVSLTNSELASDQTEVPTPMTTKFTGWELSPDDALALSVRENFENNMKSLYMVGLFSDFLVNEMLIGSQISVMLPFEPITGSRSGKKVNLGEGKYLVKKVEFLYSGGLRKTKVNLVQISQ